MSKINEYLRWKENLEINFVGDGRKFLNFWDWAQGADIVCEIKEGKLFLQERDELGDKLPDKEITIEDYISLVEASIRSRKL